MEQEMAIEQKNYERDSSLRQILVITQVEIDQSKSHLIQKKSALIGAKINLENVQMQLNQLQISILDLQSEYHRSYWQLTDNISRSLDALSNQLDYEA